MTNFQDINMSDFEELMKAKIKARQKLNSLPPEKAQKVVNDVICADMWQPDLSSAIDWGDDIPIPKSWTNGEENS